MKRGYFDMRPKDQRFIDEVGAEADLFLAQRGRVLAYRRKDGTTVALGGIGRLLRKELLHIPRVGFDEWDRMLMEKYRKTQQQKGEKV